MSAKLSLAILAGRVVRVAARMRGGGSAIPGRVAMQIEPAFLTKTISQIPRGVIAVSGSNGKSTTTNMLAAILRAHGLRVFTNPSGGNLPQGIASAVLADVSVAGKLDADIAVLEVDEGYGPRLAPLLKPRGVLLLNVQIDQLNRFHEPERVVTMLEVLASAASDFIVLNRDDNHLADFDSRISESAARSVALFGAAPDLVASESSSVASAQRFDGKDLAGQRPASVEVVSLDGARASIRVDDETFEVRLPSRGLHYAFDAAGAIATARAVLGDTFSSDSTGAALESLTTVYGRGEMLEINGELVEIIMMKNPASLQLNLDALEGIPEQVLLAVDEGTPDPSWVWDISFDSLQRIDLITGSKAYQFAVRLGYEGKSIGEIDLDIKRAVSKFLTLPKPKHGHKLMILNYEQMMLIRNHLGFKDLEGGGK